MAKRIFTCLLLCLAAWLVSCEKEPEGIAVTGISLPGQTVLSLLVGEERALQASVTPSDASNIKATWESSNPAVVTVSEAGALKALCVGSAVITVKTLSGGYTATCTVTVTRPAVTLVSLSEQTLDLAKGGRHTLTATLEPVFAAGEPVAWSSSDEQIATVDQQGNVTAGKRGGEAVITAEADGQKATCTVHVTPDIYLGGYIYQPGLWTPTLWTNGQAATLPGAEKIGYVTSVQASEGDLYAAGYIKEGTAVLAVLWKNGVMTRLSEGFTYARAQSVYISGTDVYVAGYVEPSANNPRPALWKNGQLTMLGDEQSTGCANAVLVDREDVYVAGYVYPNFGNQKPALWKNGQMTDLPGGQNWGEAFSVFVAGEDVYVTGEVDGDYVNGQGYLIPTLWKNGTASRLPGSTKGGRGSSVFVRGTDVYVAGYIVVDNGTTAVLWTNREPDYLCETSNNAEAYSVVVFGDDVYVGGCASQGAGAYATLWKNGEPTEFGFGNIYSVFVY